MGARQVFFCGGGRTKLKNGLHKDKKDLLPHIEKEKITIKNKKVTKKPIHQEKEAP